MELGLKQNAIIPCMVHLICKNNKTTSTQTRLRITSYKNPNKSARPLITFVYQNCWEHKYCDNVLKTNSFNF